MLWLMVVVQWWLNLLAGRHTATSPFGRLFLFLLALLGFLQLVVFTIDLIEFCLALLYNLPRPQFYLKL